MNAPVSKRFWFTYDLIKPDPNKEEEFSFEEVRSRVYYKANELANQQVSNNEAKYLEEIKLLKLK